MAISDLYTSKQIQALKLFKKDFFTLILHGAKRSGKTIANNDLFLLELKRIKKIADKEGINEPQYILAGFSQGNINRNILSELANKYGLKIELNKHSEFNLFGVKVCCFGHGKVNDMDRIRGMTSYGAYINEATTGNEKVIREIFNRCSGTGARVVMDTNPADPEHYIKKDYIDKADNKRICEISFNLDDNTFLSNTYKDNIKAVTPTGIFYERDILGRWTTAEGAVYQDFDKSRHIIKDISNYKFKETIAGVDWGYSHFGAISVIGITDNDDYILLKSIREQFKEIDYWVARAREIKQEYGNINFYCDSARTEHIDRFRREKLRAFNGDKAVISGIEKVASLIKQDKLLIYQTDDFLQEIYKYVWDKKTGMPKKEFDDLMDAIRYAIYTYKPKKEFKVVAI